MGQKPRRCGCMGAPRCSLFATWRWRPQREGERVAASEERRLRPHRRRRRVAASRRTQEGLEVSIPPYPHPPDRKAEQHN